MSKHPGYEYKTVNIHQEPMVRESTVEAVANLWADLGWRTVSVNPTSRPGFWDIVSFDLLLERRKPNPFNKDGAYVENQRWHDWEEQYGEGGVR